MIGLKTRERALFMVTSYFRSTVTTGDDHVYVIGFEINDTLIRKFLQALQNK